MAVRFENVDFLPHDPSVYSGDWLWLFDVSQQSYVGSIRSRGVPALDTEIELVDEAFNSYEPQRLFRVIGIRMKARWQTLDDHFTHLAEVEASGAGAPPLPVTAVIFVEPFTQTTDESTK